MQNKTFIHVGCHKAGSTFFQAELLPKLVNLNTITFYDGDKNKSLDDFLYISQCADLYYEKAAEIRLIKKFKNLKNIFISSEAFSGTGYNIFTGGFLIKSIAQRLHNIFPNGKIVIIIRNQKDAIESYYKDDIMYGYLGDFESWFKWRLNNHQLNYFKYLQLIDTYMSIFGKKNVKVLLFEKIFEVNYIKKNFEEFGVEINGIQNVNFQKMYNETYSSISLKIAPLINRFFGSKLTHGVNFGKDNRIKVYNLWRYQLSNYFNKLSKKRIFFNFDDYDNLLKINFQKNNNQLSKLININLKKNGYI